MCVTKLIIPPGVSGPSTCPSSLTVHEMFLCFPSSGLAMRNRSSKTSKFLSVASDEESGSLRVKPNVDETIDMTQPYPADFTRVCTGEGVDDHHHG